MRIERARQRTEIRGQRSVSDGAPETAAGEGGNLDLDLNHDLDQSGPAVPGSPATSVAPPRTHSASGGKALPCAGGKTAKQDKSKSKIKSTKESGVEGEGHSSEGNILTRDFDKFAKAPPRPQSASGGANAAYYSSIFAVMDAAAGYGPTGRSGAGSGRRDSVSSADAVPVEETPERRSDQL